MLDFKFNPDKNYKRSNGDVFTGKQANNLLEIAKPEMQAMLLLSLVETDEPVTASGKYGVAAK